MFRTADRTVRR